MKMEKKYYNTPEVKFHQLRIKSMIAASDNPEQGEEEDFEAKGGMFFFDEDED
jgi:hypothetical protein